MGCHPVHIWKMTIRHPVVICKTKWQLNDTPSGCQTLKSQKSSFAVDSLPITKLTTLINNTTHKLLINIKNCLLKTCLDNAGDMVDDGWVIEVKRIEGNTDFSNFKIRIYV